MNVLVLGSGGREHTFCWKLAQSKIVEGLYAAPGNAGTALIANNLDFGVNDFVAIKKAVLLHKIDLVVVGPEDPLVNGIHDFFLDDIKLKHITVIGPQKLAATLEGSKEFAKEFMMRHNIPTAKYGSFTSENIEEGYQFLDQLSPPYVLKADGLAAGKGVLIIEDLLEAKKELSNMLLDKKFGAASAKVVIEEFLTGIELSCFVLTDGKSFVTFPMAKDYKRIGEGDTGLNTGGMGAVSPVPFADEAFTEKIHQQVVVPTINGLAKDNIPYVGFVFIGLIKIGADPFVIEYNVRMGDPETEVVLPRIKNDFGEILLAVGAQRLSDVKLEIDTRAATTVVAVSGGYPEDYQKGKVILGLDRVEGSQVFHAGTIKDADEIKTNGGRVLAVTSFGKNHQEAIDQSFSQLEKIQYEGIYYRKDIGFDL
ncbi:phosphoribosylamine--glycine ligase [Flavobacteriaceae bacterium]|jgi:phosphoribosylamine---glycine ligase|nr:phosphoribosylamine--glycine ligase [Flavobacteriaceae bacterium]